MKQLITFPHKPTGLFFTRESTLEQIAEFLRNALHLNESDPDWCYDVDLCGYGGYH
jgi:hypothetical protein